MLDIRILLTPLTKHNHIASDIRTEKNNNNSFHRMRFKELWDTNWQAPIALFKSVHQHLKYIQLAFFTRPAISRESDILPGFASFPGFSEGWEVGGDEKNLLLCPQLLTHRPIGVGGATDEFWAPTQSGFFRTIGKGENTLKPYFTASAPGQILHTNTTRHRLYMNFQ